jgi:copper transport protein
MIIGTKPLLIFFLIAGLVLIVGSLSHAYGHANLISSDPPKGAVLKSAPERITLTFSEELEPSFSTVYVLDSSQNRVDNGDVVFSKDRRSMSVTLPELKEGVYTVVWRALSAVDGHITAGFFPITIGNVSLPSQQLQEGASNVAEVPSQPTPWEVLLRWFTFASQTALMGSIAFQFLIWRPCVRRIRSIGFENVWDDTKSFRTPQYISFTIVAATTVTWLIWHVYTVSPSSLNLETFSRVLLDTRFGNIWILRITILGIIASILYVYARSEGKEGFPASLLMVATGALLLTTSLNSHSAAATQSGILPIVSDWVHLLGASFWLGGLLQMVITISSLYRSEKSREWIANLLAVLIPRFSLLAIASIAAIGITGFFAAYILLKNFEALLSTSYGVTLILKLILIIPMILLGALSQFKIHSALIRTFSLKAAGNFLRSIKIEAILGAAVLLTVGLLTSTPPPLTYVAQTQNQLPTQTQHQNQQLVFTGVVDDVRIELEINPGYVGVNNFTVRLSDRWSGEALPDIKSVLLKFTFKDQDIGTARTVAKLAGEGVYTVAGGYLSLPGRWDVLVHIRREKSYDVMKNFEVVVARSPNASTQSQAMSWPVAATTQADPFFSNLLLTSSVALLVIAGLFLRLAWRKSQLSWRAVMKEYSASLNSGVRRQAEDEKGGID